MAVSRANVLDDKQLERLLDQITANDPRPLLGRVAFLLSYKAGLRVQEIAGLCWKKHILDAEGNFRVQEYFVAGSKGRAKRDTYPVIFIGSDIGKYKTERTLPMHPLVEKALRDLLNSGSEGEWVIPSRKKADQSLKSRAHALMMWINRFYEKLDGFDNCTSHSGRRTFITKAARRANYAGCSLEDVRQMAGHKHLTTTQAYIETTSQQADLISLV